jgi:hypothetical protein
VIGVLVQGAQLSAIAACPFCELASALNTAAAQQSYGLCNSGTYCCVLLLLLLLPGEDPHSGIVASVSSGNPALVTCVDDERLEFQVGARGSASTAAAAACGFVLVLVVFEGESIAMQQQQCEKRQQRSDLVADWEQQQQQQQIKVFAGL